MRRLKLWLAIIAAIIIIAVLVIWTQNLSAEPWVVILIWAVVIIVLQLMFIYIIVIKNRHK